MILLHPSSRPGWRRTHPRELSDLAWRSVLGLARAQGITLSDPSRVDARDAERLAAALMAAIETLPARTVPDWMRMYDRALVRRGDPRPADYWSTMEDRLQDVAEWISQSGGFRIEVRHPRPPHASTA